MAHEICLRPIYNGMQVQLLLSQQLDSLSLMQSANPAFNKLAALLCYIIEVLEVYFDEVHTLLNPSSINNKAWKLSPQWARMNGRALLRPSPSMTSGTYPPSPPSQQGLTLHTATRHCLPCP